MILLIIALITGFAITYLGWFLHVSLFARLRALGIQHNYSYLDYFDSLLKSLIIGVIVGRLAWISMNFKLALSSGFGVLPYERVGIKFEWLTTYPWRVFAFYEGMVWYAAAAGFAISVFILLIVPSIRLIQSLKIDKNSVRLSLITREVLYFLILCVFLIFVSLTIYYGKA